MSGSSPTNVSTQFVAYDPALKVTPRVPPPQVVIINTGYIRALDRLAEIARRREQTSVETLNAALDVLEAQS